MQMRAGTWQTGPGLLASPITAVVDHHKGMLSSHPHTPKHTPSYSCVLPHVVSLPQSQGKLELVITLLKWSLAVLQHEDHVHPRSASQCEDTSGVTAKM